MKPEYRDKTYWQIAYWGFVMLLAGLSAAVATADETQLIMPPYEVVYERQPLHYWAALSGKRNGSTEVTYQWTAWPAEKVAVAGANPGQMVTWTEKNVHDAWNLEEEMTFQLTEENDSGAVILQIELKWPDGRKEKKARQLQVKKWRLPQNQQEMQQWRKFCLTKGLHWLQKRQRPTGGWTDYRWSHYRNFQQYDDFYTEPSLEEPRPPGNPPWHEEDNDMTLVNTGCALWAFGNCGFGLGNSADNPFRQTVLAGIDYIAARTTYCPLSAGGSDYDRNRNGVGVVFGQHHAFQGYVHPMIMAGLIAAGKPRHTVTVAGEQVVLSEVLTDAYDTVAMTLLSWGRGGWPYQYDVENGFDQSIAGWHYLALDAIQQWDIEVGERIFRECMRLLQKHFDTKSGWFIYSEETPMPTLSLVASGLTGLDLVANADPWCDAVRDPEWQHLTAGNMQVQATQALSAAVKSGNYVVNGYFTWAIVRALQKLGIKHIHHQGNIVDWRHAAVSSDDPDYRPIWCRVMQLQQADGRWEFADWTFCYSAYSDELETAFMLLVLSDEVVRETATGKKLRVSTVVPAAVASSLTGSQFTAQEALENDLVLLSWEQLECESGENFDLSLTYLLPLLPSEGNIAVQEKLLVEYIDAAGSEVKLEHGPLWVSQRRCDYSLFLVAPEQALIGEPVDFSVQVTLPRGDNFRLLRLPVGFVGEHSLVLNDKHDEPVQLLGVESLTSDFSQLRDINFSYRPHAAFRQPLSLPMTFSAGDSSFAHFGICSGVELLVQVSDAIAASQQLLLWYNERPIELLLSIAPANAEFCSETIFRQVVSPTDFGGVLTLEDLLWPTAGCSPGKYLLTAELWRGQEVLLATQQAEVTLLEIGADVFWEQAIVTDQEVYWQHQSMTLTSMVGKLPGGRGQQGAQVEIEITSGGSAILFQAVWQVPAGSEADFWRRSWQLPLFDWPATDCQVRQKVIADDGRVLMTEKYFTVRETSVEKQTITGFFAQDEYQMAPDQVLSSQYTVTNCLEEQFDHEGGDDDEMMLQVVIWQANENQADDNIVEIVDEINARVDKEFIKEFQIEAKKGLSQNDCLLLLMAQTNNETTLLLDVAQLKIRSENEVIEPDPEPDPDLEPEPDPDPDPEPEPDPDPDPDPDLEPEPDPDPDPDLDPDFDPDPAPDSDPDPDSAPDSDPDPEPAPALDSAPSSSVPSDSINLPVTSPDSSDLSSSLPWPWAGGRTVVYSPSVHAGGQQSGSISGNSGNISGGQNVVSPRPRSLSDESHPAGRQETEFSLLPSVTSRAVSSRALLGQFSTESMLPAEFCNNTIFGERQPPKQENSEGKVVVSDFRQSQLPKQTSPELSSAVVPDLRLVLSMHALTGAPEHVDVLELLLPDNWPQNGRLQVGVDDNGFYAGIARDLWLSVHSATAAPAEIPTLLLHVAARRRPTVINALNQLVWAGQSTLLDEDCQIKAPKITLKTRPRQLVAEVSEQAETISQFQCLWTEARAVAKEIRGNLKVKSSQVLASGVYFVHGDVYLEGGLAEAVTILSTGNIVVKSQGRQFNPAFGQTLFLSRRAIFLAGSDLVYRGHVCSLRSVLQVRGRHQHFCGCGLWAEKIVVRGTGNAFTAAGEQTVITHTKP